MVSGASPRDLIPMPTQVFHKHLGISIQSRLARATWREPERDSRKNTSSPMLPLPEDVESKRGSQAPIGPVLGARWRRG